MNTNEQPDRRKSDRRISPAIGEQAIIDCAKLRAVNAAMLEALEMAYVLLADINHNWPQRHTTGGQSLLCDMRNAICLATGRVAQDVQDDYGNRAAIARAEKGE